MNTSKYLSNTIDDFRYFFKPQKEKENFYFVAFAGIQKMRMCLTGLFPAFFYAVTHKLIYTFFCLDAKEPKNQGLDLFL